jgi:phytoene synthase
MTEPPFSLDADLRRTEPDLWLSSRLVADPAARARLIALYAVHADLARVAGAASNPLAGEIRLAWWREEVEALLAAARPLGHPALQALAGAGGLDAPGLGPALDAMIEARHAEFEPHPFADETALLTYLDGVDGGLMRAAAVLLAPEFGGSLVQTGRAWGWARLLRERGAWQVRGRDWAPAAWGEASEAEIVAHVRHRVADALKAARGETAGLPTSAFPAVAYSALARPYAQGRAPSAVESRARLLWAVLRGRL